MNIEIKGSDLKKSVFVLFSVLCVSSLMVASGQAADSAAASQSVSQTYNLLLPPVNASMALFGKDITSIARPETPADFQVSVINGIKNFQNGQSYGFQFAPY